MSLKPGSRLGQYELLAQLGTGGMGAVYKAHDPTLQRTVAIKVLARQDEDASARLLQEARAASALNHPHICTIYEVGEATPSPQPSPPRGEGARSAGEGPVAFIVMEHVEGKPLSALIPSDGLPPESVIRYGTQIADALAHAHERGIVHRDLKSANVVITPEGRAKVLDFGLAARMPQADAEAVTKTQEALPHAGMLVGTLAYMAPEVLRGEAATARSDIWALGVVLYEMASGRLPFEGASSADLVSSILKDSAAPLPSRVSAGVRGIVQRCLSKETGRRYASGGAAQAALEAIQPDTAVSPEPSLVSLRGTWTWHVAAIAIGLALGAGGVYYLFRAPAETTFDIVPRLTNPRQLTSAIGIEDHPAWAPDGQTLAYAATQTGDLYGGNWDILITGVRSGQPVNRTADHVGDDRFPSWSPDGSQIAFWSDRDGGGYFVMSALGGFPRRMTPTSLSGSTAVRTRAQWSPDGSELAYVTYEPSGAFVETVSLETRTVTRRPLPGRNLARLDLSWSPDGRFFAYADAVDVNSEVMQLWLLRTMDGEAFPLSDGRTYDRHPSWATDGRTLYFVSNRGGSADLWQQRLSDEGTPIGASVAVTTGLGIRSAMFSPDGTKLAYSRGGRTANVWRVPILEDRPATWADAEPLTFDQAFIEFVDVSPDGTRLLVSSDRSGNIDLWMLPAGGGELQQLTTDPTPDWLPRWSPDGQQILFYAYRTGNRDVFAMPTDGGPTSQLTRHEATDWHPSWSPDGRDVVFSSTRNGTAAIWAMSADGSEVRQVAPALSEPSYFPAWSPDGEWVIFTSQLGGQDRMWRVAATGGEPELVTEGPAYHPRWSRDGQRIFFTARGERAGNIWVAELDDGTERPVTNLAGRRGSPGAHALSTAGGYLYLTWEEDLGDIWVMDVVQDEDDGSND